MPTVQLFSYRSRLPRSSPASLAGDNQPCDPLPLREGGPQGRVRGQVCDLLNERPRILEHQPIENTDNPNPQRPQVLVFLLVSLELARLGVDPAVKLHR